MEKLALFFPGLMGQHGLLWLSQTLREQCRATLGTDKGIKIYAFILHIHTFRFICENCAELALGLQQPLSQYLVELKKQLVACGFIFSDKRKNQGIRMLTMVSGEDKYTRGEPTEADKYEVPKEKKQIKADLFSGKKILHSDFGKKVEFDKSLVLKRNGFERTLFFSSGDSRLVHKKRASLSMSKK